MFRKMARHLKTGERGERMARWYLLLHGYRILGRNYLCPLGEIDIVAMKGEVIVFVEVRTRQAEAMLNPLESINNLKLANMIEAARHYMTSHGRSGSRSRFDIISIRSAGPLKNRIHHFQNAFHVTDERPVSGIRLKALLRHRPRPGGRPLS
jgi:putative endonuclease